jgi:hypothetical protein
VGVFARASAGYSVIDVSGAYASFPNPKGLVVDGSAGLDVALIPNLFLIVDLGYQAGFQSGSAGDIQTSYLHLGAGLAVGF